MQVGSLVCPPQPLHSLQVQDQDQVINQKKENHYFCETSTSGCGGLLVTRRCLAIDVDNG